MIALTWLLACIQPPPEFPAPDAYGPLTGPGGPAATHADAAIGVPCTYLMGAADDVGHHNLVGMYDGYLWMPWSPESGGGGLTTYAFDDPCAPTKVGEVASATLRESHTLSFHVKGERTFLALDEHVSGEEGGIGIWDVTDAAAPRPISRVALPGYDYPDAYFYVALSTYWQGDRLYVSAGFLGIFVVDVSDPEAPFIVAQHTFPPPAMLVGRVLPLGNTALVVSAGLPRTVVMDLTDPLAPELLADFDTTSSDGTISQYYFAGLGGKYGLFARKEHGGGPIVYDLSDPVAPVFVSDAPSTDGDGGYVFRHEDKLFQGDSNFGAMFDFSDPAAPTSVMRFELAGDLDTVTPIGNVAVVSVDDDANPGQATSVVPWTTEPDARGPRVELHAPADGALFAPLATRIGLSFDEQVEPVSVFAGSFRVWAHGGEAVSGQFDAQEGLVNFTPDAPLLPDTTYVVQVPAGGITDGSGNPTTDDLEFRFSTGAELRE